MALKSVKVLVNGIEYEATIDWDESISQGTATVTFNAPEETSWTKEGHYYPVQIDLGGTGGYMGEGEYLTNSYDDTDETYGNELRLVVKEKVPPVINLIQPLDGYYLTVRDNVIKFYIEDELDGSNIDYSTLQVVCAEQDITNEVTYVKYSNGYYCKAIVPDTTEGVYELHIEVKDYDGNLVEKTIQYEYLVLITDRTQSDVDRYNELHTLGLDYMTDEQKAEWLTSLKGAYNFTDLNRVEKAVRYMSRRARAYKLKPLTKIDWKMQDYIKVSDGDRYIKNVSDIRNVFPFEVVDIPTTMNEITFIDANNIEKSIIQVDEKLNEIASQYLYSGEIFGGDI